MLIRTFCLALVLAFAALATGCGHCGNNCCSSCCGYSPCSYQPTAP